MKRIADLWKFALTGVVSSLYLASGSLQAAMSQTGITAPGGFAQTGAYSASVGSTLSPGSDVRSILNYTGTVVQEQSFSGNTNATSTSSYSGEGATNTAFAQATMGVLHLSASNDAPNSSSFARALANGGWNESFTISDPAHNGQSGFTLVKINVNGTLYAQGFAGSSNLGVTGYKDHSQLTIYNGAGAYFSRGQSDLISTDRQYASWSASSYGYSENVASRTINDSITLAVPITYGTPFTLGIYAAGSAGMRSSSGVAGNSLANLDFSNTLSWGGIMSVLDNTGAPVTGYSLISGTGIDWANPVPEPSTLSLLALGVLAMCRRRHSSGPTKKAAA